MNSALKTLPMLRVAVAPRPAIWRAGARRAFSARATLLEKYYTKNHEWIELDSSKKTGTIGISTYAAKALGDVVYVELPEDGLEVAQGDSFGAVESVKSASDIYAPVSGTVIEVNSVLSDKPAMINSAPEGDGWLAKLEITNAEEVESLMSKQDYDALDKDESH